MSIHIPRNAVAVQFFLSPNCCLFMALLFGMFSAMVEIYDMHIWRTCKFHKKGARSDMEEGAEIVVAFFQMIYTDRVCRLSGSRCYLQSFATICPRQTNVNIVQTWYMSSVAGPVFCRVKFLSVKVFVCDLGKMILVFMNIQSCRPRIKSVKYLINIMSNNVDAIV